MAMALPRFLNTFLLTLFGLCEHIVSIHFVKFVFLQALI